MKIRFWLLIIFTIMFGFYQLLIAQPEISPENLSLPEWNIGDWWILAYAMDHSFINGESYYKFSKQDKPFHT